ncbi:MAG: beta-propeller domain-containing protein [Clostridiales bacterium]|nr:beta-propeller domain-containing protein [Clostridiales bacterium]
MKNDFRLRFRKFDNIRASNELKIKTLSRIKNESKGVRVMKGKWAASIATLIISVFALTYVYSTWGVNNKNMVTNDKYELVAVNSKRELISMLNKKYREQNGGFRLFGALEGTKKEAAADTAQNHSNTNVQVEGIDESDIVKTDGKYLYVINRVKNEFNILTADKTPKNVYKLSGKDLLNQKDAKDFKDYKREIYLNEMFLYEMGDKKYYILLSTVNRYKDNQAIPEGPTLREKISIMPIYYGEQTTLVSIFEFNNEHPKIIKQYEISGNVLSSRLKEGKIYLVSTKGFEYHILKENENAIPYYIDYGNDVVKKEVDINNIKYNKNDVQPIYTIITSIDIDKLQLENQVVLGYFENMYMSHDSLYLTKLKSSYEENKKSSNVATDVAPIFYYDKTVVYKFELGEKIVYKKYATVDGMIINQFSMDEYDGYFRIATTENKYKDNKNITSSSVYILDKNMNLVGNIKDIAKDERIYSTRFVKDKLYMVTFKQVDPLFVIDLKNPREPKILGLLKIPGYSTYLHPYDENNIIGFGMDTGEMEGRVVNKGMKVALFDVSDVNKPKQKASIEIGGKGTFSESLYNHKALVEYKKYNLYAFEINETKYDDSYMLEFSGLCLMEVKDGKISIKAKVTHDGLSTSQEFKYYGGYRGLFVDDLMFVISTEGISVIDLDTMKEVYKGRI